MLNEYKINEEEGYATLFTTNRKGESFEIFVDLEDLPRLKELNASWHVVRRGSNRLYAQSCTYVGKVDGKYKYNLIQLQRFILDTDKKKHIDHINHNALDCRKENLRITTVSNNGRNRKSKNSNNTSGYRNVSYVKSENKYIVQLQINGKNTRLGVFDDVHEAGKFAEEMRKKYYKQYAGRN